MTYNIKDFGAIGDGGSLNTEAIQNAIDTCHKNGGGRVLVEGGTYLFGSITLKSGVELHIAANTMLLGSQRCEDYPEREDVFHVKSELLPRWRNACYIYAEKSENNSKLCSIGTPNYASPEQCCATHNVDCRSDIYSLGATIYHLASGKLPFTGADPGETIANVIKNNAVPLQQYRPDLSEKLLKLIEKMMMKNPAERPASPDELLEEIHSIGSGRK